MSRDPTRCRRSPSARLRAICHGLIGLVILATLLRTWLVEGWIVPIRVTSGSMAESLVGPHRTVLCRRCGQAILIGLEFLPDSGRAVCGRCGEAGSSIDGLRDQPGTRLLIDRLGLSLRDPRRWEMVVFRCPESGDKLCIKRVVGLPGETVEIRGGDVYINGTIVRKGLEEQRRVARQVRVGRVTGKRNDPSLMGWRRQEAESGWRVEDKSFAYRPGSHGNATAEGPDWLVYQPVPGQPIWDDEDYNQGLTRKMHRVSDLMLRCRVEVTGAGRLWLAACDGHERFELAMSDHGGQIVLTHNGQSVMCATMSPGSLRGETLVELSLFDSRLLFALDRHIQLAYPYERTAPRQEPVPPPFEMGSRDLRLTVSELTVWRDIYYTHPPRGRWGLDEPYQLVSNELFLLGDNSPISEDSRTWAAGGLPLRLLVGTPLGVD